LADELLSKYASSIAALTLLPAKGGRFEVTVNDALVFSKLAIGHHAAPGEVARLVEERLGVDAKA
jgi:selenoprotein W-related protein